MGTVQMARDPDARIGHGELDHGTRTPLTRIHTLCCRDGTERIAAVLNHVAEQLDEDVLDGQAYVSFPFIGDHQRRHPIGSRLDFAAGSNAGEAHRTRWLAELRRPASRQRIQAKGMDRAPDAASLERQTG